MLSLRSNWRLGAAAAICLLIFVCRPLASAAVHAGNSEVGNEDQDKDKDKKLRKTYALLFGTVYGPGDHPVYGVLVKIRPASQKKAKWELYSDHSGEFAQRLPAGQGDYVVWAELGRGHHKDRKEIPVHFQNDERIDISLHVE